VSVVPG